MRVQPFLLPSSLSFVACGLVMAMSLVGCGGSGASSSATTEVPVSTQEEETQLMVSLTDAEGDFLSYSVDVSSISLTHSNGAVLNVLTEPTTVDFAQYVDISELLAVRTVPVGMYESVSLNIDFSDAQIVVQSESGEAIEADIVDEEGEPLESASINVSFAEDEGFVLSSGIIRHVTLDFDLDASNDIEIEGSEATVTVSPVWIADPMQADPKPLRLRGTLANVDVDAGNFELDLRPFREQGGEFGEATVFVSEETEYEIDGLIVESAQGLSELNDLDSASPVITLGSWDIESKRYTATEILAGTSVPWAEADILRGTVIARSGNEISVRGAIVELSDGRFTFNDDLTLLVGDATEVHKRANAEVDASDISVGSAIRVIGTLIDDQTMDASEGVVRVRASSLSGLVVSSEPISVDLSFINGRRASMFDFSGTGTSAEQDANADSYELYTGELDTSSIIEDAPIRALGFVSEFGTAPEDFDVNTLVDASNVKGVLTAHYGREGSVGALTVVDDGLSLSLEGSRSQLSQAGIPRDLSSIDTILIESNPDSNGIFSLVVGRRVVVFTRYVGFIEALSEHLSSEAATIRFTAQGEYDSLAQSLTSNRLQVHLSENDSE